MHRNFMCMKGPDSCHGFETHPSMRSQQRHVIDGFADLIEKHLSKIVNYARGQQHQTLLPALDSSLDHGMQ